MHQCPHCGHQSIDPTRFCPSCGNSQEQAPPSQRYMHAQQPPAPARTAPPDSHLAKAIASTVLCCLPLGIAAIVQASNVNSKFLAGDLAGAEEASRKADSWGNWSIGLGAVGAVLYVIFMVIVGVMDS